VVELLQDLLLTNQVGHLALRNDLLLLEHLDGVLALRLSRAHQVHLSELALAESYVEVEVVNSEIHLPNSLLERRDDHLALHLEPGHVLPKQKLKTSEVRLECLLVDPKALDSALRSSHDGLGVRGAFQDGFLAEESRFTQFHNYLQSSRWIFRICFQNHNFSCLDHIKTVIHGSLSVDGLSLGVRLQV